MAISDKEGLPDRGDESDSFVVDIERLSHGINKGISANSMITQPNTFVLDIERFSYGTDIDLSPNSRINRSFSRKGSFRGERKSNAATNGKATDTKAANGDMSPKGGSGDGGSLAQKCITVPMGTAAVDAMNKQAQVIMMMSNESRCTNSCSSPGRRYSGKRSPAWLVGPRTVLAFFATLSSMGTILLIYFTLSTSKLSSEDNLS